MKNPDKKPWHDQPGGLQLQAFVGVWGVKTSEFEGEDDLIRYAAAIFEIPVRPTCAEMAAAVAAIPKKSRSKLARKNLGLANEPPKPAIEALAPRRALPRGEKSVEADLLHQVVMAVINAGQGDILKGIDDLNSYYNCKIPTVEDIVGGRPEGAVVTKGEIAWDDKVYSFSVARTVKPSDKHR